MSREALLSYGESKTQGETIMKFRAFAFGAAVAVAATGLVPATAMASATPTVSTGTGTSSGVGASSAAGASSGANAGAGASSGADSGSTSGSGSSSSTSDKNNNNINVSVVTQLPHNYYWDDKKIYDDGHAVALPAGDRYADGGVVGANDSFYFAPSGKHDGVAVAPMRCQGGKYDYNSAGSGHWIGSIVDGALKACAGVYDAAYGIIATAFGNGETHGGGC
jgi:hypothetical protein